MVFSNPKDVEVLVIQRDSSPLGGLDPLRGGTRSQGAMLSQDLVSALLTLERRWGKGIYSPSYEELSGGGERGDT